jgi:hypothetical protein
MGAKSFMTLDAEFSTYGTADARESNHIPIIIGGDDLTYAEEQLPRDTATQRGIHDIIRTKQAGAGSETFHSDYAEVGIRLFWALMGSLEKDTSAVSPLFNNFLYAGDTVGSLTVKRFIGGATSFTYPGCAISSMDISVSADTGVMTWTPTFVAKSETKANDSTAYVKDTGWAPIKWSHLNDSDWGARNITSLIRTLDISITRGIDEDYFILGSSTGRSVIPPVTEGITVTGSIGMVWDSNYYYNSLGILQDLYSETEPLLHFDFTNADVSPTSDERWFQIYMPKVHITADVKPVVDRKGIATATVPFAAMSANIAANALKGTTGDALTNAAITDSPIAFAIASTDNQGTTW